MLFYESPFWMSGDTNWFAALLTSRPFLEAPSWKLLPFATNTSRWKGLTPSRVNGFHFILRRIWVYMGWVNSLRSLWFRDGVNEPRWDIQPVRLRPRCRNHLMPAPAVQPFLLTFCCRSTTDPQRAHSRPAACWPWFTIRDSFLVVWRRRHELVPVDSELYPCSAPCDQPCDPSRSLRVLISRGRFCAGSYW